VLCEPKQYCQKSRVLSIRPRADRVEAEKSPRVTKTLLQMQEIDISAGDSATAMT